MKGPCTLLGSLPGDVVFFARLHAESTRDAFQFSEDDVAACGDGPEFLTWLEGLPRDDPSYRRGTEIRLLRPRCGACMLHDLYKKKTKKIVASFQD